MNDSEAIRAVVDEARQSRMEPGRTTPSPLVGAGLVRTGDLLAVAHRGEVEPGEHAEFVLLERKLRAVDVSGGTLYTTLEPCSSRRHPKVACAQRIVERGIGEVVIGVYDPNPIVYRSGWRILRDAGIRIREFPKHMRSAVEVDNADFLDSFRLIKADTGRSSPFDYTQNGGRYVVHTSLGDFKTRWTLRGGDSIYAYGEGFNVAPARHAQAFDEIDDPGALDFSSHSAAAAIGEIVAFRAESGYLLAKVVAVRSGPERRHDRFELVFDFEVRALRRAIDG